MQPADAPWNMIAPLVAAMPRITAAVTVAPLFPASLFPLLLRSSVAVSLALYLYPHMAAGLLPDLALTAWLMLILKEAFLGLLVGLAVGTLVWALEAVGSMLDFQVGFSNAQVFDPFGGHQAGPLAEFLTRAAVVLFVTGGGLQLFASLLIESFRLWPVGSFYPSLTPTLADFAGASLGSLLQLIVRLAAPAALLLALIDVSFGLVGRAVPQLNVFYLTMPIKGALAALMIALYLAYIADLAATELAGLPDWLKHLAPVIS